SAAPAALVHWCSIECWAHPASDPFDPWGEFPTPSSQRKGVRGKCHCVRPKVNQSAVKQQVCRVLCGACSSRDRRRTFESRR
ncbi:AGAP008520-PA, partial [Anopheles gambiae str. PEST]